MAKGTRFPFTGLQFPRSGTKTRFTCQTETGIFDAATFCTRCTDFSKYLPFNVKKNDPLDQHVLDLRQERQSSSLDTCLGTKGKSCTRPGATARWINQKHSRGRTQRLGPSPQLSRQRDAALFQRSTRGPTGTVLPSAATSAGCPELLNEWLLSRVPRRPGGHRPALVERMDQPNRRRARPHVLLTARLRTNHFTQCNRHP